MLEIGVQSKVVITDKNPYEGFHLVRQAGFSCVDFSLNEYLLNLDIYDNTLNNFFDADMAELKRFFTPHVEGATRAGIKIHQVHMPYPIYVPNGDKALNSYLWHSVAPKSMELCHFLGAKYIVVHNLKLARLLGSESKEWEQTEYFLDSIAPIAKKLGLIICIENLYDSVGGGLIEGSCCNAHLAAERIDLMNERYGAEVLGFCFDTGHANIVGIDFEDFLTTLGHRLKVLHIHDNDGVRDLHQIPYTFTRTRENAVSTDWNGFLRGLKLINYQGVLSFETAPVLTAFPEAMRFEALSFIAQIGRYFSTVLTKD